MSNFPDGAQGPAWPLQHKLSIGRQDHIMWFTYVQHLLQTTYIPDLFRVYVQVTCCGSRLWCPEIDLRVSMGSGIEQAKQLFSIPELIWYSLVQKIFLVKWRKPCILPNSVMSVHVLISFFNQATGMWCAQVNMNCKLSQLGGHWRAIMSAAVVCHMHMNMGSSWLPCPDDIGCCDDDTLLHHPEK